MIFNTTIIQEFGWTFRELLIELETNKNLISFISKHFSWWNSSSELLCFELTERMFFKNAEQHLCHLIIAVITFVIRIHFMKGNETKISMSFLRGLQMSSTKVKFSGINEIFLCSRWKRIVRYILTLFNCQLITLCLILSI